MLLGFALVLTRISGFLLVLPVFGWNALPMQVRAAVAVLLSLFFCTVAPLGVDPAQVSTLGALLLLGAEAMYGLALGLIVMLLFSVAQITGHIIEQQMGMTMSEIIDPLTGEETGPLANLMAMIFILLFLSADGHHLFLLILSKSYSAFPAGNLPTLDSLVGGLIETGSVMFVACLRLAAPLLAAFLVLLVALALLARLIPEMDIFFVSTPVLVAAGLFLAAIFMPFLGGFVGEMANWMAKLLPI
ncbi:MAG: flagellar biosynthetic protein FliR [Planctomycetes bacterium]|nr:flagellar biosynthetic protein FliR [Planctomycetota bacterium]